jgi:hypothetical protein
MNDDWEKVFDAATTWAELQDIIADHVERNLAAARAQLEGKAMVPGLRDALIERLQLLYLTQIRETFTRGWLQLQADAASERDDTVQ